MSILDLPLILETRRNHAVEHATLHILAEKYPQLRMAGHSNPTGFFIFSDAPAEQVRSSVVQAMTRLRAGESNLAIHAGCGTNFATSLLMAGSFAWLGLGGARSRRSWLWRIPFAVGLALLGFILSQPLGPLLQARVTTEAELGKMELVEIVPLRIGNANAYRVITREI
jgi:hypothetical protein